MAEATQEPPRLISVLREADPVRVGELCGKISLDEATAEARPAAAPRDQWDAFLREYARIQLEEDLVRSVYARGQRPDRRAVVDVYGVDMSPQPGPCACPVYCRLDKTDT